MLVDFNSVVAQVDHRRPNLIPHQTSRYAALPWQCQCCLCSNNVITIVNIVHTVVSWGKCPRPHGCLNLYTCNSLIRPTWAPTWYPKATLVYNNNYYYVREKSCESVKMGLLRKVYMISIYSSSVSCIVMYGMIKNLCGTEKCCFTVQCNLDYPDPFGHSLDAGIPNK